MSSSSRRCRGVWVWALGLAALLPGTGCDRPEEAPPVYTEQAPSPHGTGKLYMGREIARVTDHGQAGWMDRPAREMQELPGRVMRGLDLPPDAVVADIGAGTGYFTFRLARQVPFGQVYAVDIQPAMLDTIRQRSARDTLENVVPILGTIEDPNLPPASVDWVLIADAYHEFSHPREMMAAIVEGLRPGGRVALIEFRAEDPTLTIEPLHAMTEAQIRKEMEAVGLEPVRTLDILPQQHFLVYQKPQ